MKYHNLLLWKLGQHTNVFNFNLLLLYFITFFYLQTHCYIIFQLLKKKKKLEPNIETKIPILRMYKERKKKKKKKNSPIRFYTI